MDCAARGFRAPVKFLTVVGIRRRPNLPDSVHGCDVLCIASAMPSTAYDRQPLKGAGFFALATNGGCFEQVLPDSAGAGRGGAARRGFALFLASRHRGGDRAPGTPSAGRTATASRLRVGARLLAVGRTSSRLGRRTLDAGASRLALGARAVGAARQALSIRARSLGAQLIACRPAWGSRRRLPCALAPLAAACNFAPLRNLYSQNAGSLLRRAAAFSIEVRQEASCFCSCPVMKPMASALRTWVRDWLRGRAILAAIPL